MLESRKPFMVEFSGTPEAGKTSTISAVADILRSANYKVITLRESAESLPCEAYLKFFEKINYPKELINTDKKEPHEVSNEVSNIILRHLR